MSLPLDQRGPAAEGLALQLRLDANERLRRKKASIEEVWEHYCRSLPPTWLSPLRQGAVEALTESTQMLNEQDERILELRRMDWSANEIDRSVGLNGGHGRNILWQLRKQLGPERVPLGK